MYLASGHPLAGKESISFSDLEPYPCLSFEQGNKNSFYFAEEVLSNLEYKQTIKADDRATMLNLMTGLNGSFYLRGCQVISCTVRFVY